MPAFRYRAVNSDGKITTGSLDAKNEADLELILAAQGLELISVRPMGVKRQEPSALSFKASGTTPETIVFFCTAFSRLLSSGMPLTEALSLLADADRMGRFSGVLRQLRQDIDHGKSLSDSFGQHTQLFDAVFLALLKAGEISGNLSETFDRLGTYQKQRLLWKQQLNKALRYPLFLLAVAGSTTLFMLTLVVPQVVDYLTSLQNEVPFVTQVLIALSTAFVEGWKMGFIFILIATTALALVLKYSTPAATYFDGLILRAPFMGSIIKDLAIARFTQSLARLITAGFSLPEAIDLCFMTLHNRALQKLALQAKQRVLNGEPASAAHQDLFSQMPLQILRVGEQSGRLPASFMQISEDAQIKAQEDIDRFLGSLEPLLTLLVGALLAWVVLAVLGPLYTGLGKTGVLS